MIHYNCNKCNFHKDINFIPRDYLLDNGRCISMMQRHVWCSKCSTITPVESLVESESARNARHELIALNKKELLNKKFKMDFQEELCKKWIREAEEYEQDLAYWQMHRKKESHCLVCGNMDISVSLDDYEDLLHTGCGGILECTITIVSSNGPHIEPHKYSINGKLIQRGSVQGRYEGDTVYELQLWSL